MNTVEKSRKYRFTHRAVAQVIATLLMVAIAVVGGTIIFVFSQGFYNQAQISGTPTIELVKILGYDARDVQFLNAHDGIAMVLDGSDPVDPQKNIGERVTVFVKNDSVNQVFFTEIRLGGTEYTYVTGTLTAHDAGVGEVPTDGEYSVLTAFATILEDNTAVLEPGQAATVLIQLNDNYPIGRDIQFKLTTTNGAIFVSTVVMASGTSAPGGEGDDKVQICHSGSTILVPQAAVQAHLDHGDSQGLCAG